MSSKVQFEYGKKVTVNRNEIAKELKGKLSDQDISQAQELVSKMSDDRALTLKILTGQECHDCKETSNAYMTTQCGNKPLPFGSRNANIVFVNKMPTVLECGSTLSHSDTVGHFLFLILSKLGHKLDDFYFTDFVKCPNPMMNQDSMWHCAMSYFMKEMYLVKPKILICEGMGLLKLMKMNGILNGLPDDLKYGVVYDSSFISSNVPLKVMSIYDLEMVLQKQGDDLQRCKTELWSQIGTVVQSVQN